MTHPFDDVPDRELYSDLDNKFFTSMMEGYEGAYGEYEIDQGWSPEQRMLAASRFMAGVYFGLKLATKHLEWADKFLEKSLAPDPEEDGWVMDNIPLVVVPD